MSNKISFVIPSYNNLRYLKNAYRSIRTYADKSHEIVILNDASTDGTKEWLSSLSDNNLIVWNNPSDKPLGHTITYNIGAELATNDIFGILHADMFIGPFYVENILKHLSRKKVVAATRIEPPLHPAGKEKIIMDFGVWPEEFKENDFLNFVKKEQEHSRSLITRGIFAPWYMYKEDFLAIGGHDPIFAPFPYEDSDIFQRFVLAGYELIQSRDALVYHLTCRGHKWTDNQTIGVINPAFFAAEENARKNYLRKWNTWIQNDEYHFPIIPSKYDISYVIKNCTHADQLQLEILSCRTYADNQSAIDVYIKNEQSKTSIDLTKRIMIYDESLVSGDVQVIIDMEKFTSEDQSYLTQLNKILQEFESGMEVGGTYELGNLTIIINRLENIVDTLTKLNYSDLE